MKCWQYQICGELDQPFILEIGDVTRSRLSKIHYQKGRIIVHKDPKLMPPRKEDWRTFNVREDGPKAWMLHWNWWTSERKEKL